MPRVAKLHRLSQSAITKATAPCILNDGGGLRLVISSPTACKWVLRYTFQGRAKDIGLGAYPIVGLQEARDTAEKMRRLLREGKDPFAERCIQRGRQTTFREAFYSYWEHKKKTLSNGKHIWQWTSTMENHVFPKIGDRSVADITAQEIVAVLQPIWHEIPETGEPYPSAHPRRFRNRHPVGMAPECGPVHRHHAHTWASQQKCSAPPVSEILRNLELCTSAESVSL